MNVHTRLGGEERFSACSDKLSHSDRPELPHQQQIPADDLLDCAHESRPQEQEKEAKGDSKRRGRPSIAANSHVWTIKVVIRSSLVCRLDCHDRRSWMKKIS